MKILHRATVFTSTVLVLGFVLAAPSFALVKLAPHRAVYDLELGRAKERSGVKGLTGRMAIELTGSRCEGWSVSVRLVNNFSLLKDRQRLIDTRTTSFESGDGKTLTFMEREYIDNKPKKIVRLKASASEGKVVQRLPSPRTFKIPLDTIFPVTHQIRLIEKAQKNITRDKSTVYDGSDQEKIYQAISFIGKLKPNYKIPQTVKGKGAAELLNNVSYWPVSVSYFLLSDNGNQDTPTQQFSFDMFENGIAGNLEIDYGEFSLKGTLSYLEKLPVQPCK